MSANECLGDWLAITYGLTTTVLLIWLFISHLNLVTRHKNLKRGFKRQSSLIAEMTLKMLKDRPTYDNVVRGRFGDNSNGEK